MVAMRSITLSLLFLGAAAQMNVNGVSRCLCVPKNTTGLTAANCSAPWATSAGITDCYVATGLPGNPLYPADVGDQCGKHLEPGFSDCFNTTTMVELPAAERLAWCDRSWCYVDPCECTAAATVATYFNPVQYYYSYDTCGDVDLYTEANTPNTVGDATCPWPSSASMLSTSFVAAMGFVASLAGLAL